MLLLRHLLLVAIVATVASVVGLSLAAGAPPAPRITSVTVRGSERNPVITVLGVQLGKRPRPNPAYHPLGHPPLCPTEPTKPLAAYGLDYGSAGLFIADGTQSPGWAAGRYRPQVSELDCIGLLIDAFSPTKIVFRLGAAYREPTADRADRTYHLAEGDSVVVGVNGAQFNARVHYRK